MKLAMVKQLRNYECLKFGIPIVKIIFNDYKTETKLLRYPEVKPEEKSKYHIKIGC